MCSALGKAAISRLQIWEEHLAAAVCSWLLKKGAIRLQILEEGSFNEYFCPSKHTGNFHYE